MLPTVLAAQLIKGTREFLKTSFTSSTATFMGLTDEFVEESQNLFKGPYISVALPFRKGESQKKFFTEVVPTNFEPYFHQELAFKRLSGKTIKPTLVATGTGSGKTESFMFPILDYCRQNKNNKGIKAIIIYPMNALATDQAKRFARTIFNNEALHGITVGLFVGDEEEQPRISMTKDSVITCKNTLRQNPPDILLTNYKMLDWLLMRPKDQSLWARNTGNQLLRFLAVDEIHTFDGAQGTDLASLIRRLRAKLGIVDGQLACIGTSATMGSEGSEGIRSFASSVFAENFDEDSIIKEFRISAEEFFAETENDFVGFPDLSHQNELNFENFNNVPDYLKAQYKLWFYEETEDIDTEKTRIELGRKLKELSLFKLLLKKLDGRTLHEDDLIKVFKRRINIAGATDSYFKLLVISLTSLTSWARGERIGAYLPPFLNVRVQLWLRELNRMVATLDEKPRLIHSQDISVDNEKRYHPVIHCRDCNAIGWGGVVKEGEEAFIDDIDLFYQSFFARDHRTTILFPYLPAEAGSLPYKAQKRLIDKHCGQLYWPDQEAEKALPVVQFHMLDKKHKFANVCPFCNANDSLTILGARAASLTSVLIGQTFASVYNDDKKMITFSDSVQDAAHRAGFFGARSYQFTIRSCIQQALMAAHKPVKITEMSTLIKNHWQSAFSSAEEYVGRLIAPDMAWLEDFDELKAKGRLPANSNLTDLVNQRIDWMVYAEYGFRSNIGRTLERSCASVADFKLEAVDFAMITARLQNGFECFRDVSRGFVEKLIYGLLLHMKKIGAIFCDHLETYVNSEGNLYAFNKVQKLYLPPMSPKSKVPKFLSFSIAEFEKIVNKSFGSWCYKWLEKNFSEENFKLIGDMGGQIYQYLFDELVKTDVVKERSVKDNLLWGINPEYLVVSTQTIRCVCDFCHQELVVSESAYNFATGMKCLRHNCRGNYQICEVKPDYYKSLYSSGHLKRIVADEHTGLLSREERERVERNFIERKDHEAWKTNLLSATPTLEMGIDIGDLSTVVLCSVPPNNANYTQRIGRAGRSDGNSLNATVANGNDHDLYFYSDPNLMLQGKMHSPGIFIDASAILQRQFLAFCMDKWVVENNIREEDLPFNLAKILENLRKNKANLFPFSLIDFIQIRSESLLNDFFNLYGAALNESTRKQLQLFAVGKFAEVNASNEPDELKEATSLSYKILNRLKQVEKEEESLSRNIQLLNSKINEMNSSPAKDADFDEVMAGIQNELDGLKTVLKSIRNRQTFEFFTSEGLLPNYAFPESGVTLKSIIYRRKQKPGAGASYETFSFEYERPGITAISELAPNNSFYAGGRKARIDQIDLSLSSHEKWRFCDKCNHSELDSAEHLPACPKCGSRMWADSGRVCNLLRLKQVMANTHDRESRLQDDSDQRNPVFYAKQLLIDFDQKDIQDAYAIENEQVPFGFEFIRKAVFREINFGQASLSGEDVAIAGRSMKRPGFVVCKYCGKVQSKNPREASFKPLHSFTCEALNSSDIDNFIESLYLYREFTSEAIRILLPISPMAISDVKMHSLIAAFQMGLKEYFKGSVDHLHVSEHFEAVGEEDVSRKYIVLFDGIPGGTGYLRQMMRDGEPVFDILQKALNRLCECECNQEHLKDGCYQCIFAYKNNFKRPLISREKAKEIIKDILSVRAEIKKVKTVSEVSANGLNDSELEERFLVELGNYQSTSKICKLKPVITSRKKTGYLFEIGKFSYEIEQQVEIREKDGVEVYSKADFVIYPLRNPNLKPVVVFTDGFSFHKDRIDKDSAQRTALAASKKFIVWSLTWNDVCFFRADRDKNNFTNFLSSDFCNKNSYLAFSNDYHRLAMTSFDWLMEILENGNCDAMEKRAKACAISMMKGEIFSDSSGIRLIVSNMNKSLLDLFIDLDQTTTGGINESENVIFAVCGKVKDLNQKCLKNLSGLIHIKDDCEIKTSHWAGALRIFNIFQFLNISIFSCTSGVKGNVYENISFSAKSGTTDFGEWDAVYADCLDEAKPLVKKLSQEVGSLPEVGYELQDTTGAIITEFELAWPNLKIGLVLSADEKKENCSWKQFDLSESDILIQEIKNGENK